MYNASSSSQMNAQGLISGSGEISDGLNRPQV